MGQLIQFRRRSRGIPETVGWILLLFAAFAWAEPAPAVCEPCFGIDADVAVDAPTIRACSVGATEGTEYEVHHEDAAGTHIEVGCFVTMALFTNVRVRARARFCPGCDWSEWSPWARQLHPTETIFTCRSDHNYDGIVNGADFGLFKDDFNLGPCQ